MDETAGWVLRVEPGQRKVRASPMEGWAFKEELSTLPISFHLILSTTCKAVESYCYSSHFAGRELLMSVCGVSSIAAFRPTPCPAETQHSVPQHCPPGLLAGGRRPSGSGGKWLLKVPIATKTASDSPRTHFVLRG